MHNCPPEVLLKIFSLACLDGGATGCSLSLVSKHIGNVSSTVQLQSVYLNSAQRMGQFLAVLQTRAPELRHVKHLLVSDCGEPLGTRGRTCTKDEGHIRHYVAILLLVGPDLITLGVSLPSHIPLKSLAPKGANLSNVRNLMVDCSYHRGELISHIYLQPQTLAMLLPLPSVIRLQVHGHMQGCRVPNLLEEIAITSPALTHLAITSILEASDLPRALREALPLESERTSAGHQLPQSLQCIIVQPADVNHNGPCGSGEEEHLNMIDGVECLAETDARVVLGPSTGHFDDDVLLDWLDVANGGNSPWRMPPQVSLATLLEKEEKQQRRMQRVEAGDSDYDSDDRVGFSIFD